MNFLDENQYKLFTDIEEEKKFEEAWKQDQIETREVRGTWKHALDFLFSCISVSVGLGSKCSKCMILHFFEDVIKSLECYYIPIKSNIQIS